MKKKNKLIILEVINLSGKKCDVENFNKALVYYEIIKEGLIGLSEIIRINFEKQDFFYETGFDNIYAVHDSLLCLLNIYNPSNVLKEKLMDVELKEHNNLK